MTQSMVITGPSSIMETRVSDATIQTLSQFPQLRIRLLVNDLDSRVDDLKKGIAQFAILHRSHVANEMDSKLLKAEEYILVAGKEWKGRNLKDIAESEVVIDFDPSDHSTLQYMDYFGFKYELAGERHFVNNNFAIIKLFVNHMGYGVLTKDVALPFLKGGELIALNNQKSLKIEHALAWYPRPYMPKAFQKLISSIK